MKLVVLACALLLVPGEPETARVSLTIAAYSSRPDVIGFRTSHLRIDSIWLSLRDARVRPVASCKRSSAKNNWYLSTARANSVVQFMIEKQFPAKNLAAAGYGEFDPIAANGTEPNRELNRRIGLILVPNLEEPSLTGAQL